MRKVRIFAHISLDGVISPSSQGEDSDYAHGGWTAPYRSPAGAALVAESFGTGFDLLLGRRTYDLWSGFWPKAPSSPMADGLNAATKYVATHRPEGLGWGQARDLGADVVEGIRGIKASDGPDLIVCGSTTLTSVLFEHGLVDEVILAVYPVLLGRGKRFFPDSVDSRGLTFVSTQATPTGVLLNAYRYDGPLQSG
jgi:dihydrofolate reductase